MTNEQLDEIATKIYNELDEADDTHSVTKFTCKFSRRLLTEVQKMQEPVFLMREDELKAITVEEKQSWIAEGRESLVADFVIPLYKALEMK